MRLFSKKGKVDKETDNVSTVDTVVKDAEPMRTTDELDYKAHFGVLDVFTIDEDTRDIFAMTMVKGRIRIGDAVYITNPGEENAPVTLTTIKGIEIGPGKSADEASECMAALRIGEGEKIGVRKGTVGFARECTKAEVHSAYSAALGQSFVVKQNMEISEDDSKVLTISDMCEILRLGRWYMNNHVDDNADKENYDTRFRECVKITADKIMASEGINVLVNKDTGEPHMFSQTLKNDKNQYGCTPPDIMLFTNTQMEMVKNTYPEDKFEYLSVENGEDKKGIYNFLGEAFYLNGACGIIFPDRSFGIDKSMLVPEPDYDNTPEISIPITNPDVEMWLLLIGQIGQPETEDEKLAFGLYYRFFSQALLDAKLLVPMKHNGDIPKPDKQGRTVLTKDTKIYLATREGKSGRQAINMYTDWKRLRMQFGDEWDGMIQPVSGFIDTMDCALNATSYYKAGCYIDRDMYEDMKKTSKMN